MNLRNVLRTYSLLRQLTDDESALLQTLNSLSESERDQLVESLAPAKSVKKATTKRAVSKSRRASSLAEQIKTTGKVKSDNDDNSVDPNAHCQKWFPGGIICDEPADANVHHLQTATGYHEFVAGKSSAAGAAGRSSTNGAQSASDPDTGSAALPSKPEKAAQGSSSASSSTVNTEEETASVGAVAGGSSE